MNDYGLRVAKKDKSAFSADLRDIQLTTSYPFAKIDPTNDNSFQTITINILTDPADNTLTSLYQFPHNYSYTPQFWGLWNVSGPSLVVSQFDNAYGRYISSTGVDGFSLYYKVDTVNVTLYVYKYVAVGPLSLIGVTAQFTCQVFVDDLQAT